MRRSKAERDEAQARLILTTKNGTPLPLTLCVTEILRLRADLEDAEQEIAEKAEALRQLNAVHYHEEP